MAKKEINIFNMSFLDLLSGALGGVLIIFLALSTRSVHDADYPTMAKEKTNQQLESIRKIRENRNSVEGALTGKSSLTQAEADRFGNLAKEGSGEVGKLEKYINEFQNLIARTVAEVARLNDQKIRTEGAKAAAEQKLKDTKEAIDKNRFITAILQWHGKQNLDLMAFIPNAPETEKRKDADLCRMSRCGNDARYGGMSEPILQGPGMEVFSVENPKSGTYQIWAFLENANGETADLSATVTVFYSGSYRECKVTFGQSAMTALTLPGGQVKQGIHVMDLVVKDRGFITRQAHVCR